MFLGYDSALDNARFSWNLRYSAVVKYDNIKFKIETPQRALWQGLYKLMI